MSNLAKQILQACQLERVLQRLSGGAVSHSHGEYRKLLGLTQLIQGMASIGLGGRDLGCAWFILRQEFVQVVAGQSVDQGRLQWLRASMLEQVRTR